MTLAVLITGATGYVGRHLAARLLTDGYDVHALVRGTAPRARMEEALRPFGLAAATLARLHAWPGALASEAGVADSTREALRAARCRALIHSAGLTRFDAHLAASLHQHNVIGTQTAHALARELRIPQFHHLGTAYVQGLATHSLGADEITLGQAFRNPYEASKHATECWLRAQALAPGESQVIYRPAIVVGGHALGAGQSVSTLYTFIKAMHFVRQCCARDLERGRGAFARLGATQTGGRLRLPFRVAAQATASIDLVGITDVVDAISSRLRMNLCGRAGVLLPGTPHALSEIARVMADVLRIEGLELVPVEDFARVPANALESHFARMTRVYTPYLFGRVPFGTAKVPARPVDLRQMMTRFLAELTGSLSAEGKGALGNLALDSLGVHSPEAYFEALVEGQVGREFMRRHAYVDARIAFELEGVAATRACLHFAHGRVQRLPDELADSLLDCRYRLDSALFMGVVSGMQDLRTAFLSGKVRITGNKELALKFGALLGGYYQHLPEHLATEMTT